MMSGLPNAIPQTRTTRSSSGNQTSFRPSKCKTSTYQRCFFIRTTRTWNSLPIALRSPDITIREFNTVYQHIVHFCVIRAHSNWFSLLWCPCHFCSCLLSNCLVVDVSSSCLFVDVLVVVVVLGKV